MSLAGFETVGNQSGVGIAFPPVWEQGEVREVSKHPMTKIELG